MTGPRSHGPHPSWMSRKASHFSSPAKSGPPAERRPPPPNRPFRWQRSLLIVGIFAIFTLLRFSSQSMTTTPTTKLAFSSFVHDVQANRIVSATIGTDGNVTGALQGGRTYKSQIPLALQDNQLTGLLEQHRVTVTGTGPETSVAGTLLGLLPLLFFVGVILLFGRSNRRRMGGIGGIGSSRAKLYDLEKPATRFTDVAGYGGAKREVSEV